MLKKLTTWLLLLTLTAAMAGSAIAFGDNLDLWMSNPQECQTSLAHSTLTVDEWLATPASRAELTYNLYLELLCVEPSSLDAFFMEQFIISGAYIARNKVNNRIDLYLFGNFVEMYIAFTPGSNTFFYGFLGGAFRASNEDVISDILEGEEYYIVWTEDICAASGLSHSDILSSMIDYNYILLTYLNRSSRPAILSGGGNTFLGHSSYRQDLRAALVAYLFRQIGQHEIDLNLSEGFTCADFIWDTIQSGKIYLMPDHDTDGDSLLIYFLPSSGMPTLVTFSPSEGNIFAYIGDGIRTDFQQRSQDSNHCYQVNGYDVLQN